MRQFELKKTLKNIYQRYHQREYIPMDPLVCVRAFKNILDREIFGLVAASLSYGRVENIIAGLKFIQDIIGPNPGEYIARSAFSRKTRDFSRFRYRFNSGFDIALLLESIRSEIDSHGSLHAAFQAVLMPEHRSIKQALQGFVNSLRNKALHIARASCPGLDYLLSSPEHGSACKRMNMYLRWMVRPDDGIDLGIWHSVSPSMLIIPLDVHLVRASKALGLTSRATPDWRMAEEITDNLKKIDPDDPVKYDFSLCRHGMMIHRASQDT